MKYLTTIWILFWLIHLFLLALVCYLRGRRIFDPDYSLFTPDQELSWNLDTCKCQSGRIFQKFQSIENQYRHCIVAISRFKTRLIMSGRFKQILNENREWETPRVGTSLVWFCEALWVLPLKTRLYQLAQKYQVTICILFEGTDRFPHCLSLNPKFSRAFFKKE